LKKPVSNGLRCWAQVAILLATTCVMAMVSEPIREPERQSEVEEQAITFRVGSLILSGTLLRPIGEGSHPGIVLLHGSGPGPRQQLRMFAERFARLDFAVLIFDKRGSGASEGSWTEESLDDLTDDALAAAAFLKAQPGVDSHRVGVWGISQAGWVIPHAVTRAPGAFAFAIIITGGGVRPLEIEEYDYAAALDRAGVGGDDRRNALALVERFFLYLKTGEDRAGLELAIQAAREKSWFKAVDVSRVLPAESARTKWEWVTSYDPAPDMRHMTMPVLVVLGGKDRPELSNQMNQQWRSNLALADNSDATLMEFLNAEHGIAMVGTHHNIYGGGRPTYVAGYLDIVDAWLRAHEASSSLH
jgi:uncharacterized protein